MEVNINTALDLKANQADVDTAMNAKANQAYVDTMEANINTALETKANQTDVDAKANQADVDTLETNINTALDTKANQAYVDTMEANINTALETKANQADVNTALDTKASKAELDAVVSASQPVGNYLTQDDLETAVGASAGAGAGAGLITAGTTIWTGTTSTGQSVVRTFGNWLTGIKSGYDALNDGFGLEEEADIVEEFNLSRYVEKPSDFTGDLKGYVEGKVSGSVLKPSDWLETDNLDTYVTMKTENIDGGAEISGSGAYLKITDRDVAGTGMPGIYFLRGENGGTFGSSPAMDWSITADINGLNVSRKSTDPNGIFSYDGSILELKESGIVNIPKADGLKINNEVVAVKNQHYTIDQVNTFLSGKADVGVSYTKAESDADLGVKANSVDVYNRTQADNRFQPVGEYALTSQIPDISGLATTTALNEGLASKQDAGDYALSSEIPDVSGFVTTTALNEGLATKADASALSSYTPTLALTPLLDAKAPQSTTYTKTEVDTKLADYTLTADLPTGVDVDTSGLVPFSPTYVAPEGVSWGWTIHYSRPDLSGNPARTYTSDIFYDLFLVGNPSLKQIIDAFKQMLNSNITGGLDLSGETVLKNEFDGTKLTLEFEHNWFYRDFDFNYIVFENAEMRTRLGLPQSKTIKEVSQVGNIRTWRLEIPMNPIIDNLEDHTYLKELGYMTLTSDDSRVFGVGTNNPYRRSKIDVKGSVALSGGAYGSRPANDGGLLTYGEISGNNGDASAGFLRLSGGGYNNDSGASDALSKSFIDICGYSQNADFDRNISFYTYNAPRMRITTAGFVGIGRTDPIELLTIHGNAVCSGGGGNSHLRLRNFGSVSRYYGNPVSAGAGIHLTGGAVYPANNFGDVGAGLNIDLGGSGYKWNNFFYKGSFNPSDFNLKRDIVGVNQAEKQVANRIMNTIKTFRMKESYENKGEEARFHTGVIAQEVEQAFRDEGLDPFRYGILACGEHYEVDGDRKLYDENGEWNGLFADADTPGAEKVKDDYHIQYTELLCLMVSGMAESLQEEKQKVADLLARVEALESQVTSA